MRRIALIVLFAVPLAAGPALADDDVGCGLGTQLWEGSSGVIPKVLAATTNGWFGTQTFGISSGTMGCSQGGVITASARTQMFVADNMDRLVRDMAVGSGETLDALAALLEIEDADRDAFAALTQGHFADLVPSTETTAGELLDTLGTLMREDTALGRYASS